jgi:hypothetical protein
MLPRVTAHPTFDRMSTGEADSSWRRTRSSTSASQWTDSNDKRSAHRVRRMGNEVNSYDVVTLVVAITGLGLALLSLGWQAAIFVLSGSRVRVSITRGMVGGGNLLTIDHPDAWNAAQLKQYAAQGLTTQVVAVKARNAGRMPVSVEHVTLELENGMAFIPPTGVGGNPPVPHRLEAGARRPGSRTRQSPRGDEGVGIGTNAHPLRRRARQRQDRQDEADLILVGVTRQLARNYLSPSPGRVPGAAPRTPRATTGIPRSLRESPPAVAPAVNASSTSSTSLSTFSSSSRCRFGLKRGRRCATGRLYAVTC